MVLLGKAKPPCSVASFLHGMLATLIFQVGLFSIAFSQTKPPTEPQVIAAPAWPDSSEFITYEREASTTNLDEIHQRIGYPAIPKDADLDGKFIVRILVDENGNYVRHYVVRMAHPAIMERIEPLVPEFRWIPAEKGGRPVPSWVTLPFTICFRK
jgi:hypothetical protein